MSLNVQIINSYPLSQLSSLNLSVYCTTSTMLCLEIVEIQQPFSRPRCPECRPYFPILHPHNHEHLSRPLPPQFSLLYKEYLTCLLQACSVKCMQGTLLGTEQMASKYYLNSWWYNRKKCLRYILASRRRTVKKRHKMCQDSGITVTERWQGPCRCW